MCLGNLNRWNGDVVRTCITGAFGVPGENDIGRREMDFCAERWLCLDNKYFEHNSLHKHIKVARGQDEAKVKSITDLVMVKKDMLRYLQDVRADTKWDEASQTTMLYCYIVCGDMDQET